MLLDGAQLVGSMRAIAVTRILDGSTKANLTHSLTAAKWTATLSLKDLRASPLESLANDAELAWILSFTPRLQCLEIGTNAIHELLGT